MDIEIVKMSAKGQLVVPQEIREKEGFAVGDRFIPLQVKDGVLFKRVELSDIKTEFEKLTAEVEKHFRKSKVSRKDISGAIRWARKK